MKLFGQVRTEGKCDSEVEVEVDSCLSEKRRLPGEKKNC